MRLPYLCYGKSHPDQQPLCVTEISSWSRRHIEIFLCTSPWEGHPPVTGGFPSPRPGTRSFDVFFDQRLNKRLSKQSRCQWFVTPSLQLWGQCNVSVSKHCLNHYIANATTFWSIFLCPSGIFWEHDLIFSIAFVITLWRRIYIPHLK